jgi:GNAT superfamily N-acetyltransferase
MLEDAESAIHRNPEAALSLSRAVLAQPFADDIRERSAIQIHLHAQRLIIEALIDIGDFAGASLEFQVFLSLSEPSDLYVQARERLIHNAGSAAGLAWITGRPPAPGIMSFLDMVTAPKVIVPVKAAFSGRTAARMDLLQAVAALAKEDRQKASIHLEATAGYMRPGPDATTRDIVWLLLGRHVAEALHPDTASAIQTGDCADRATETPAVRDGVLWRGERYFRIGAPELVTQGLPGPDGTWLRLPHPGETAEVSELLGHADDELAPWAAAAIEAGTLSFIFTGLIHDRPIEDIAAELVEGGPSTMLAGQTVVLVAVDRDRRLVGAVQARPQAEFFVHNGLTQSQKRDSAVVLKMITGVGVTPSRRNRGIGQALTRASVAVAWRSGCRLIFGQFSASSGLGRFFASCSFQIVDQLSTISLTSSGLPAEIRPQPGHQLFASRYSREGESIDLFADYDVDP